MTQPTIRFSVIGINHEHIYGQVRLMLRAGAEFVNWYASEPDLVARFGAVYPQTPLARSEARRSWKIPASNWCSPPVSRPIARRWASA